MTRKMKYMRCKVFAVVLAIGAMQFSDAQLVLNNTQTVEWYVNNVLLGSGVTATNITFNGGPGTINTVQVGSFNGTNANMGLPGGMVLVSGDVSMTLGPNNSGGFTSPGISSGGTDPDLIAISSGFGINDYCIIEFDFIPTGDSIKFRYVWGSEEYMEWVNSSFNDVFGFFLSGPGINGPYSNGGINIARIPGTTLPVTIDNVNANNNSQYYVHNGDGGQTPYSIDPAYIQFDGITVPLTAEAVVQCGQTYHIKIALADSGDQALDCGVFLEAGSFSSNALNIETGVNNPPAFLPAGTVLEGCVDGFFTLFQPDITSEDVLELTISGTATAGVDYQPLPNIVTIPAGELSITIPFIALSDQLTEGIETVTIQYTYINSCGDEVVASATISIMDYIDMTLDLGEQFVCPGQNLQVSGVPQGGAPNYSYNWSTGAATSSVSFSQGSAGNYSVTVTDYCNETVTEEFTVIEPQPFVFTPDIDVCFGLASGAIASGGAMPYSYIYPQDSLSFNAGNGFTAIYAGEYEIVVIDGCGQQGLTDMVVEECDTWIPNVFTPNNDGENDTFKIFGIEGFPKSELYIYNRWGNKVYESTNYNNTWKADDNADGVYFYVFKRSDGKGYEGYVHVLRENRK